MSARNYIKEAGYYDCVVEKPINGWFGQEESGTEFIRVPVVCTEEGTAKGLCSIWKGYLTDAAFDKTIEQLAKTFRFNGDLEALYRGTITLEGMPCQITVKVETYTDSQGKTKEGAKVAWINPVGGGGAKPMDEAKVKGIFARLGSRAKAIAKASANGNGPAPVAPPAAPRPPAPARPSSTQAQPAPDDGDDVPF